MYSAYDDVLSTLISTGVPYPLKCILLEINSFRAV